MKDKERRVRCNWCGSVFDERHIKAIDDIEYCPVCGETGYLMDMPEAENGPRWETPEQYEKRTGEPWPDDWAVYALYEDNGGRLKWFAQSRGFTEKQIKRNKSDSRIKMMVCATEAGPPPDDWRPEEPENA
jgi:hypothetical protein